jgi:PhnB protein
MATTNIYLNFKNQTEAAFNFYKSVFGGEFDAPGISRFGDVPPQEGAPVLSEEDRNLVMHVSLPLLGGVRLMGTDAPESMGFTLTMGNNVYVSLHPDTRA